MDQKTFAKRFVIEEILEFLGFNGEQDIVFFLNDIVNVIHEKSHGNPDNMTDIHNGARYTKLTVRI